MIIYNIFFRQKTEVNYVELDRYFYNLKGSSARYVNENKRTLTQNFALLVYLSVVNVRIHTKFTTFIIHNSSIGANKVRNEVNKTRELCRAANWEE